MNVIACTSCGKATPSGSRFSSRCGVPLPKPNPSTVNSVLSPGSRLRDRYIIYIIVRPLGREGIGRTHVNSLKT